MNPIDESTLALSQSYSEYRAAIRRHGDVFDEVYAAPAYTAEDLDLLRRLPPLTVVAIAEDWCPDVYHTLSTWARLAEELDGWSFHVFRRDAEPPLIDSFLYKGSSKRIPVYAFYDARRYLQTWWSGRSGVAERAVEGWKGGRTFDELDEAARKEVIRNMDDGYRQELRRANFVEIRDQLAAFFHLA